MRRRSAPWLLVSCVLAGCGPTVGAGQAPGAHAASTESRASAAQAADRSSAPIAREVPPPREPTTSRAGPGWLGVELAKREGAEGGVLVRAVLRDSPAERAGLQGGDVVVSIDGRGVAEPSELRELVGDAGAGGRVSLGVARGSQTRLFAVELEGKPNEDEVMRKSYVGARAPDFGALTTVQGSVTPSLRGLEGRVVVLEFWASWCGVCHALAPLLNGWHDRYAAQGLTVLGVTNDPVELAGRTAYQVGMDYPLVSDGSGDMLRAYRAFALPTVFVIDKRGNVRDVLIGYSTPRLREIEGLVQKLLAEG